MREFREIGKRLTGDLDRASSYIGKARTLLGEMKNQMAAAKLLQLSRLVIIDGDVQISVFSSFGQDRIDIYVPEYPVVKPTQEQIIEEVDFTTELLFDSYYYNEQAFYLSYGTEFMLVPRPGVIDFLNNAFKPLWPHSQSWATAGMSEPTFNQFGWYSPIVNVTSMLNSFASPYLYTEGDYSLFGVSATKRLISEYHDYHFSKYGYSNHDDADAGKPVYHAVDSRSLNPFDMDSESSLTGLVDRCFESAGISDELYDYWVEQDLAGNGVGPVGLFETGPAKLLAIYPNYERMTNRIKLPSPSRDNGWLFLDNVDDYKKLFYAAL